MLFTELSSFKTEVERTAILQQVGLDTRIRRFSLEPTLISSDAEKQLLA